MFLASRKRSCALLLQGREERHAGHGARSTGQTRARKSGARKGRQSRALPRISLRDAGVRGERVKTMTE